MPVDRPVWTSVLVDAPAMFDVEEKSARQSPARTAAEGRLVSGRVGRRVRWVLTPPGRRQAVEDWVRRELSMCFSGTHRQTARMERQPRRHRM
ncbi:hypothetical protein ACIQVL_21330 [Streptomyces sp. NPDC090499]|uniref:hypothetical protein n=1 Tax=Streptomyces sp. NPDC090499 TaxID=3365965 RepID=UPI00382D3E1E